MSDYSFTFRDETFNVSRAYAYQFLLLAGSGNFSFAIVEQNKLLVWANNCPIGDLIAPKGLEDILSAGYQQKVIGLSAGGFTLVPKVLFAPEKVADFARLLDVKPSDKVFASVFDEDNEVIYKVADTVLSAVSAKFAVNNAVFGATGWVKKIAQSNPAMQTIYLNINPKAVELLNFQGGKLRFYNRFETGSEDDLAYFTLMVAKELKMPPQACNLILSGSIADTDRGVKRLREFFRSVSFNNTEVLALPPQVAPYQILQLAALSLCAS